MVLPAWSHCRVSGIHAGGVVSARRCVVCLRCVRDPNSAPLKYKILALALDVR